MEVGLRLKENDSKPLRQLDCRGEDRKRPADYKFEEAREGGMWLAEAMVGWALRANERLKMRRFERSQRCRGVNWRKEWDGGSLHCDRHIVANRSPDRMRLGRV